MTDEDMAKWRERYANSASKNIYSARIVRALLDSYQRALGELAHAHRAFLFLIDDGLGIQSQVVDEAVEDIGKLLMEAGRIPWPECPGCAVALAPDCAHAEGCEEAERG